jgi:hypothetical protein
MEIKEEMILMRISVSNYLLLQTLSSVTKSIDQYTVEKMKVNGMYDKFYGNLLHECIQINGELPFKLVAQSTFQ